jgi:hypothetical protein
MRATFRAAVAAFTALAIGGIITASASAELPEFSPNSFKPLISMQLGSVTFTGVGGITYGCTSGTGSGEITGAQTANAKFTFKGCVRGSSTCNTVGSVAGEIRSETVPVRLVYISKANHEVGLDFNYEEPTKVFPPPPAKTFATWGCGSTSGLGIRRSIIAKVTPVNTATISYSAAFSQSSKGVQSPRQYENSEGVSISAHPEMNLTNGFWEEGSLQASNAVTIQEIIAIRA